MDTTEQTPPRRRRRPQLPFTETDLSETKAVLTKMRRDALTVERLDAAISFISAIMQNVGELDRARTAKKEELAAVESQLAERLKTADDDYAKAARHRAAEAVAAMEKELVEATSRRDAMLLELDRAGDRHEAVCKKIAELTKSVTLLAG